MEALDVVVVDCYKCVVSFPHPKKDDVTGTDFGVASGVIG